MTVVTTGCLVLYMGGVDGDTAGFLLRSFVNGGVVGELGSAMGGKNFSDSCC